MKRVYISLGCDCSVAYQLRSLGLQQYTLPFDWMRIDNLDSVCDILESHFTGFTSFKEYKIKHQSDNFNNFDITNTEGDEQCKSRYKIIHMKYGFALPHEYNDSKISIPDFEEKYSRRITRFNSIVLDASITKIFVRLDNRKDICHRNLEDVLERYGIANYRVIQVIADDYKDLISKEEPYSWQRNYIPWKDILF